MADKIIQLRLNVEKIIKEWMYKGEKGTYLDCTLFFTNERDAQDTNGMIVQAVPKTIWQGEKDKPKDEKTKGPILGNAFVFEAKASVSEEMKPGFDGTQSSGPVTDAEAAKVKDKLPF